MQTCADMLLSELLPGPRPPEEPTRATRGQRRAGRLQRCRRMMGGEHIHWRSIRAAWLVLLVLLLSHTTLLRPVTGCRGGVGHGRHRITDNVMGWACNS